MQATKPNKPLKPTLNYAKEVEPQQGEIWLDADGQHSLILETYQDAEDECFYARVLCLDNGEQWEYEPFESWDEAQKDGLPYYRFLVG